MSIITTKNALCQGMNQGYAGMVGPAKNAKGGINGLWSQIESGLYAMKAAGTFSPPATLAAAVDDLKNQAKAYYPGDQLDDMNAIKDMIEACDFLNALQPVTSLINGVTGLFDEISNLIDGFALTLPEFGIGNLIGNILDALKGLFPGGKSLKDLLGRADQLINCLATLCGQNPLFQGYAMTYMADLTQLYSDLNLFDSGPKQGLPNVEAVYNMVGMDTAQKAAMDVVNAGIEGTKEDALAAVDSSIAAVKSFTTAGGIFG